MKQAMNKIQTVMFAAILILCGSASLSAQYVREPVNAYFTTKEMPDLMKFLPAPPDSIINKFTYDVSQYMWGKEMRKDPVRAEIARRDGEYGLRYIIQEFSEPFGLEISREGTPEIYKLLREATATCDSICTLPKVRYMRRRPFVVFNEHTLTPDSEASLSRSGSYPSGHTILGWSAALLLMEINPAKADTLLARGYMYGESRVIVGAHWQSDVDAGYLAASVAYAKLHTSERFLEQMSKAREEFVRLTTPAVAEPQRRSARSARRAARQQARAY